ncbi:LysR substrate-binding domain-containing protein [Pseudomonas putida]|uniref:LysR substrate-binding domain-containing protein n=1 Tax=Pseudomonas putida TaxID=303 RepID=UPI0021690FE1|nr:LysR substrate-binding domain-containing protein [Pseudomonas putida]MCS4063766.1 DNA-binding transcriptional LysR family regulator [Pseudomonas putida]
MRYDLTSLDVFIAVAETQNLTHAANLRHLAVSAVSKRISELEDLTGAPLLIRHARGVELTPAGQSLLFYARQVRQTLQNLDAELGEFSEGVKGHIRIHAITSALSQFLPTDITAFAALYPLIRFDIQERVGADVVSAVAEGRADVGVIASQTASRGLQTVPYRTDELVVVVPGAHALASSTSIRFAEVLQYEMVGPHRESSMYGLLTQQAEALDMPLKLRIRISSFDCICRMVAAGMGIAVLPRSVVKPYQRSLKLKVLRLDEAWAVRALLLVLQSYDAAAPTLRTFVDNIRSEAGQV